MSLRRGRTLAWMAFTLLSSSCGGSVDAVQPRVTLALDFGANALLELFVLAGASAPCGALLAGDLAPDADRVVQHAAEARPASGLNNAGEVRFDLDELPAEVALTFYARATEGGATLSHDCEPDVLIPADGHVDVQLVVREVP